MAKKTSEIQVFSLIRTSIVAIFEHPIILYPLCIGVFFQLLALEILYFSPRFPLNTFFGPLIRRLWGEIYLHYPANFMLLPKLFYYAQCFLYLFIGCVLNAMAISMIAAVNSDKKTTLKTAVRECFPRYFHIFLASFISFGFYWFLTKGYNFLLQWVVAFNVAGKKWLFVKKLFVYSEPYLSLFLGVLATSLFVFVIPAIVVDKKKVLGALKANFQLLFKSFWFVFAVIFLVTLIYVPVLLLRSNITLISDNTTPIIQLIMILISVLVTLAIDATVFTSTTTYYLLKKENT